MLNFLFNLRTLAEAVNAGITTAEVIVGAVQAGRARIREAGSDVDIPADQVKAKLETAIEATKALAAQVGDEAAARVEAAAGDGADPR